MKKRKISADLEKRILIGLIVSSEYGNRTIDLLRKEHFKIEYAKTLLQWLKDYYKQYHKAPDYNIKDIFTFRKQEISKPEANLLQMFLALLDEQYEPASFNVDYLFKQTQKFITHRELELFNKDIERLTEKGDYNNAIRRIWQFQKREAKISTPSSKLDVVFDPFTTKWLTRYTQMKLDDTNYLFEFDGALGSLIGPLRRNYFVSFTAPENRGKTWILDECAIQAITNKLRTLYVSLEMNEEQKTERLYKRITARDIEKRFYRYPIFDCLLNQTGKCKRRRDNRTVLMKDGKKPEFDAVKNKTDYEPCAICRGTRDFITKYWFTEVKANQISKTEIRKRIQVIKREFGKNLLKIRCYPAFDANADDIMFQLENLEILYNWVPDVLIIDYLDILKMDTGDRTDIDKLWKQFKGIAAKLNILVITADQSNKMTYDRDVTLADTTEDKRKNAHLDIKVGLNQTAKEREDGVMRFNILKHRHKGFNPFIEVMALQQLELGQPLIDSEFVTKEKKENKK